MAGQRAVEHRDLGWELELESPSMKACACCLATMEVSLGMRPPGLVIQASRV